MKHLRIKTYILISTLIVITVSLFALTAAQVLIHAFSGYKEAQNTTAEKTEKLVELLELDGIRAASDNSRLIYKVEDYAEEQRGRIMVIDRTYKILLDTEKQNVDSYIVSEKVMSIIKGETDTLKYSTEDFMVVISPVKENDVIVGAVIYRASLASLKDSVDNQLHFSVSILVLLFIIDVLIISRISKRAVRDLNNLNEKIMHNALGNFQERLPEDEGFIEIQVLAENYNDVLEKLSTIDQTRSEFVSNVSHELKTPITSMKVLAESVIQNEGATAEDYKEFMGDIVNEIDRETDIINDLLTLVKTDSKKDEMNFEEVDINEMMETIIKTVKPLATARGITLRYDNFKEIRARVDRVKLSLAISNLVENAVKYNVDNGWINCSLNSDNKYFYVKVADSGVGIPDDAKDRVFDRFYRVDKARSRDTGGTGLGLSITRSIVNAHKGTIKLYSEAGKGTTFTVKIPLDYK